MCHEGGEGKQERLQAYRAGGFPRLLPEKTQNRIHQSLLWRGAVGGRRGGGQKRVGAQTMEAVRRGLNDSPGVGGLGGGEDLTGAERLAFTVRKSSWSPPCAPTLERMLCEQQRLDLKSFLETCFPSFETSTL